MILDHDYEVPPSECPYCGTALERAGNLFNNGAPRPHDLTVCIRCAGFLEFDDNLKPVPPLTDIALLEPEVHSKLMKIRYAIQTLGSDS